MSGSIERELPTDEADEAADYYILRLERVVAGQPRIKRVQQEDADGCGVAVLAMLTGRTYAEVDAEWPLRLTEHWKDSDVKPRMMMGYLWNQGYALRVVRDRRYAKDCCNREGRTGNHAPGCKGDRWPSLTPFAPMHYAMVDSPTQPTGHWVAIDADGTVLDPFDDSRTTLDAYEKMHEVVGVWAVASPRAGEKEPRDHEAKTRALAAGEPCPDCGMRHGDPLDVLEALDDDDSGAVASPLPADCECNDCKERPAMVAAARAADALDPQSLAVDPMFKAGYLAGASPLPADPE